MDDRYNFGAWIQQQIGKDYFEILRAGEQACASAERGSFSVKGAVAKRAAGSMQFADRVKKMLFFLRHAAKPYGVTESDWQAYRAIAEDLVERKILKPEVLDLWN